MIFFLFAVLIAAAFFVSSIFLLNYGRQLGLRYLQKDAGTMTGLTTVEGAVFALMGLLLAFTISGALQRFDDRRQLVIQEANAASTAHDRLALFESEVARDLQSKLRNYVQARIDLYRMPHDYSLLKRTEDFSDRQEVLIFATTLTVALYTLTDMEYPRLGLIRIENFDHFLVDAHQQMQTQDSAWATLGYGR
jgi:hypothetical protein